MKMEVVRVEVSATVSASPDAVWDVVSVFASQAKETTQMVAPGNAVTKRLVSVGNGRLCEELTLLDREKYEMRYKLISDASNVNPFPASFLDYVCSIRLHPVTTNKTVCFVKIQCRFRTEKEMSGLMRAQWEQIHLSRLQKLEEETTNLKKSSKEHKPISTPEPRPVGQLPTTGGLMHAISEQLSERHLPGYPLRKSVSLHFTERQNVRISLPALRMNTQPSSPANEPVEAAVPMSIPGSPSTTFGSVHQLPQSSWPPAGDGVLGTGAVVCSAPDECWSKRVYLDGVRERAQRASQQPFCESLMYNPWNVAAATQVPQP